MRRFIALCLLMLLPFQFSWAAVASYCGHETPAQLQGTAEHVGHHAHEHQAPAGAEPAQAQADTHIDCAQCHGCCSGLPQVAPAAASPLGDTHPRPALAATPSALAAAPPERPQWLPLA